MKKYVVVLYLRDNVIMKKIQNKARILVRNKFKSNLSHV